MFNSMDPHFRIGNHVELIEKSQLGTVAYVGTTQFQPGKWIGVILDEPKGKNNGSVQGKEYFKCEENFGIFVRPSQLKLFGKENESNSSSMTSSMDEKSTSVASRLPQFGSKKLKLPLRKSEDGSSRESVESKSRPPLPKFDDKLEILPQKEGSTKTPGSKYSTPSPIGGKSKNSSPEDSDNNKDGGKKLHGSKRTSPRVSLGNVFAKHSQKIQLKAPSEIFNPMINEQSSPSTNVAQHVAKIKQDLEKSTIGGLVKNTDAILESLSEGAQVEYLRSEFKDCSEKLETLRIKRQEDKQKLMDYEKCRIQLQQLVEYKTKMSELHTELQRQLQVAKKDAKEAIEAREAYQEEMSGLAESVEMATLDKEVAEERAELLQVEIETLKDRVQELETDLELLKSEMADSGKSGSIINSVQLKQLEQQNERLKEAVVKMRDLSAYERREQQKTAKELEKSTILVCSLAEKNDKLTSELQIYEQQLFELKEQVDAALGSEEMVEQLTTKNLALEEKVLQLEESIEDFEQMCCMDEELQESTREFEKELRSELDVAHAKLAEIKAQMKKSQDQVHDHEQTIQKFRQVTAQFQDQVQDLKYKLSINSEEKREKNDNNEIAPKCCTFVQTDAWTDLIENELRKLESHVREQYTVEAENLKWQLEKKDKEIRDIKLALRRKAEEISEMKVRKEMAESKLQTTGKEGDERILRLQRTVEELTSDMKKKETEFDKVMDSWQKEIDDLEKENADLKDRYKVLTKKSLLQGLSAQAAFGAGQRFPYSAVSSENLDVACLSQELQELRAAFTQTYLEKCSLQGSKMQQAMATLPPLNVPKKPSASLSADLDQLTHKRHDELNHLMRECSRFQKECFNSIAVAKIIDITKNHCDSTLEKQRPTYVYASYLDNVRKFNDWLKNLKSRMQRHRKESIFNNSLNFLVSSGLGFRDDACLVGRIAFAYDDSSRKQAHVIKVNLTPPQFDLLQHKLAA